MITVLCVLRSGGVYDASWVDKLKRGVERNLSIPHRFVCLSDVEVDCERIQLQYDWPGWWSKLEMWKPCLINGKTLYLDLDTIIAGPLEPFTDLPYDFAMLSNFNQKGMVGSGVMWFKDKAPEGVWDRFIQDPLRVMEHYQNARSGTYVGDQAFIWDSLDRKIDTISSPYLKSFKQHCRNGLPKDTSIICFHGHPRPNEISSQWLKELWT